MIRVRASLEQVRAMLRAVVPQLSIQQRLKLMRELAEADVHPASPTGEGEPDGRGRSPASSSERGPGRSPASIPGAPAAGAPDAAGRDPRAQASQGAGRSPGSVRIHSPGEGSTHTAAQRHVEPGEVAPPPPPPREAPVRESLWRDTTSPAAGPIAPHSVPFLEDAGRDEAFRETHPGDVPPVPPVITPGRLDLSSDGPAAHRPPAVPPPDALSPPTPTRVVPPPEPAGAGDAELAPAGEGDDVPIGDKPRASWERRLYRLFKPARVQGKHLEPGLLSDLIRRSVTEVRSR